MIKRYLVILILAASCILNSCVDEYWPEIQKYDNVLVVDGFLTNSDDTVTVNLSRSISLEEGKYESVTGAEVSIYDNEGTQSFLYEINSGKYIVDDPSFKGIIGKEYQLHIKLANGEIYNSDFCKLKKGDPIDSVYSEIEYNDINQPGYLPQGLQFYIDSHNPENDTSYYLWRMWQTYKYQASFTLDFIFEGQYNAVGNPDSLRTCWRTKRVSEIFTYSTKNLDESKLIKYPLVFTSTDTKMLSIRYSLLVEQLSISDDDFVFWDALKVQGASQDNLYTQQPVQIRGNIVNKNNPDEVVLGNFTVAGVTKKRIYENRPSELTFYYTICDPDFESMMMVGASSPTFWPIYITNIPGEGMALGGSDVCFDCRLEGGSLTPPEFWTE